MDNPLNIPPLCGPHARYKSRNLQSQAAHQDALKDMPGGNTRSSIFSTPFPLTIASGKDGTVTSLEYSTRLLDHFNARIANAVSVAMACGSTFGGISVHKSAFAAGVCQRFGEAGVEMVRFANSGTEANMVAIATALAFVNGRDSGDGMSHRKNKSKILVFSNAYHGRVVTGGTTGPAATNLPHNFVVAPFNNVEETSAIVSALDPPRGNGYSRSSKGGLAAIIFEPMQGAGGCGAASKEFACCLRQLADEHSSLFIVDEVMTSRLGPAG
ncbi:glutamate-1-semialdehyde 2,1-aminomutase [Paracoccidioides lutzii Pb01]|uniref:Glutamate-1-semialdehyde 2,1-aminomutase n=1 Tax=Paracoccidioides lutzii (strain ATCC MYA-826 / Pb01) TaxID=502779 RepID=C1H8C8_PARBA|nr:glutamate-1-semialdehyde 2,1-aminomutase [Paracoccidioides lutzii Pb01]EEH36506.2 glutamate-1-semialdehyde 2,1-aminomutase [Paracoccidioides lutzii Pb01]